MHGIGEVWIMGEPLGESPALLSRQLALRRTDPCKFSCAGRRGKNRRLIAGESTTLGRLQEWRTAIERYDDSRGVYVDGANRSENPGACWRVLLGSEECRMCGGNFPRLTVDEAFCQKVATSFPLCES